MKKITSILVVLSIVFTLCSCTPKEIAFEESVPEPTVEATLKPTSEPTLVPTQEPTPEPTPTEELLYEVQEWPKNEHGSGVSIDYEGIISESSVADGIKPLNPPKYKTEDLLFNNWSCFVVALDADWWEPYPNARPNYSEALLAHFPNVVWREMDTGFTYAMMDGDDGTRVYLFYPQSTNCRALSGYPIVSQGKLSYSDFEQISISDTSDVVNNIDPTTAFHIRMLNTNNDFAMNTLIEEGNPPCSVHLLTDGILKYTYERSGEEGNYVYTIVDIEYHENFKMEGLGGVTDYSIAEVDYVD